MRELILDTETTGLRVADGHRVVEIGLVELSPNKTPSGRYFHHYLDPRRSIDPGALAVHGLDADYLARMPLFQEIADELCVFLDGAYVVAHNADFDSGFIHHELKLCGKELSGVHWVDSLALSRQRFPSGRHSLDAMCDRFKISREHRNTHGALLDAELLAAVYMELCGGRQSTLDLLTDIRTDAPVVGPARQRPQPLAPLITQDELARHRDFIDEWESSVEASAGGKFIWRQYEAHHEAR